MLRRFTFLVLALACLAAPVAQAAALSTGVDSNRPVQRVPLPPGMRCDCNVLWFGGNSGSAEVDRLAALGYTVTYTTDASQLTADQLAQYDVLVIAYVGPDVIASAQPAIAAYVSGGGGLLIHQPNTVGTIDYAPANLSASISNTYWCDGNGGDSFYVPTIVSGGHPITASLTDADLSGDFDTVVQYGSGYTLLARNVDCPGSEVALAAGTVDAGHVVFEDGNMNPGAYRPGSDLYWYNVFSWLCAGGSVPTRTGTWGTLKALYR